MARSGRLSEATGQYQEALRLQRNHPLAHNNLGAVLIRLGRRQEAIAHYQQALRIHPDYPTARRNLQRALAQDD